MVSVKRISVEESSGYLVSTADNTFLFDVPGIVDASFGAVSRLGDGPCVRPPQVLVPVFSFENIDAVFVGRGDQLGVFFMQGFAGPIYMTAPVYGQLMIHLAELLDLRGVSYRERPCPEGAVFRPVTEHISIKPQVVIVGYHQQIAYPSASVGVFPAGTFLGWAAFTLRRGARTVLCYTAGLPGENCLSVSHAYPEASYLLVDRTHRKPARERGIHAFTRDLVAHIRNRETVLVILDIASCSVELVLHILSLTAQDPSPPPVVVASRHFRRLAVACDIQNEYLCDRLRTKAYDGRPPLGLLRFPGLRICRSLQNVSVRRPSIIVCSALEYPLYRLRGKKMFVGLPSESRAYNIEFFSTLEDVLSNGRFQRALLPANSGSSELASFLEANKSYKLFDPEALYCVKIEGIGHLEVVENSEKKIRFYGNGRLTLLENRMVLECKPSVLNRMFAEKTHFVYEQDTYFPEEGIRVSFDAGGISVYGEKAAIEKAFAGL